MPVSETRSFPRVGSACRTCGAPVEDDQLVCLECGSRVALDYRRPPNWRMAVAIVAAVLLLVVAAGALALDRIGDDAKREVARTPIEVEEREGGAAKGGREAEREPQATPRKRAAKKRASRNEPPRRRESEPAGPARGGASGGVVERGALYAWPRELEAFTVVLISTEDRASAERFARSASKGRPARIGVIRTNDFGSLPKGFFLVFAGQYESRAQADRAAARLGRRFSGAFPQLVKR